MKFDLKQLQAFVTLADTANYREAANRLFITQPALTKQIQGWSRPSAAPCSTGVVTAPS